MDDEQANEDGMTERNTRALLYALAFGVLVFSVYVAFMVAKG